MSQDIYRMSDTRGCLSDRIISFYVA